MKNKEIIANAAIQIGLLTSAEATERLEKDLEIPLHTINGWNLRGNYRVKQGEEPVVEVKLWKRKDGKKGFYLAKAKLYTENQIEEA